MNVDLQDEIWGKCCVDLLSGHARLRPVWSDGFADIQHNLVKWPVGTDTQRVTSSSASAWAHSMAYMVAEIALRGTIFLNKGVLAADRAVTE